MISIWNKVETETSFLLCHRVELFIARYHFINSMIMPDREAFVSDGLYYDIIESSTLRALWLCDANSVKKIISIYFLCDSEAYAAVHVRASESSARFLLL